MRAVKGFLVFSYFRVLVATGMDDSERSRGISAIASGSHGDQMGRSREVKKATDMPLVWDGIEGAELAH